MKPTELLQAHEAVQGLPSTLPFTPPAQPNTKLNSTSPPQSSRDAAGRPSQPEVNPCEKAVHPYPPEIARQRHGRPTAVDSIPATPVRPRHFHSPRGGAVVKASFRETQPSLSDTSLPNSPAVSILSISSDESPNTHTNPLDEYRAEMEHIKTYLCLRPLSGDQLSADDGYINVLNYTDIAMQTPGNEARLRSNEPSNCKFTKVVEQTATQDAVFEQDPYVIDLLNHIEDLRGLWLETENRYAAVESQVREEMAEEMERRLQQMENFYRGQLYDEVSMNGTKVAGQKDPLTRAKDSEETAVVQALQSEIRRLEETAAGYQRDAEHAWHSLAQAEKRCQEQAKDAAGEEEGEEGDVGVREESATFEEVVRGEQEQAQVKVEEEGTDVELMTIKTELKSLLPAPPQQTPPSSTHEGH
ncbi:hypothetical protein DFQ27_000279 [Actinomortierella ambigua]|uniref:Uncharacterized protein n=1 Tax=Actinomortierella ambigua TaxID=1343610 RepID=A0A9P6QD21_9FUNG|nr:hypothetical protein DFQ27_000279 [Actinomortierella ambigua]